MSGEYSRQELEALFNVDEKRAWIRDAYGKRLALPFKERIHSKLSRFLTHHQATWCWHIHDNGIPICTGWDREEPSDAPQHTWEVRTVFNDVLVGHWQPYPEAGDSAASLAALLREIWGHEPDLQSVTYDPKIVEDMKCRTHQFRCVRCPPLKTPKRDALAELRRIQELDWSSR